MHIWKIGKKSCKHYKTSVDLWGNKILKKKKKDYTTAYRNKIFKHEISQKIQSKLLELGCMGLINKIVKLNKMHTITLKPRYVLDQT